jgi:general secretion pathway protein G
VTGRAIADCGLRIADLKKVAVSSRLGRNLQSAIRNPQSKGFTLLELMIVISIIIILAAVALPQYQKTMLHARETVLRDDLFQMRKMIDQYAADKGKLPQSLDELVSGHYLREIPEDPITYEKEWDVVAGEDPYSSDGGSGITDVHSRATETGTDGRPYSEW